MTARTIIFCPWIRLPSLEIPRQAYYMEFKTVDIEQQYSSGNKKQREYRAGDQVQLGAGEFIINLDLSYKTISFPKALNCYIHC
jgi:hypothetical protein